MSKQVTLVQKIWVKLTNWEFWPFSVVYFPVYFYYAWLALKSRSFFFFTAANPSIDFGGMLGESKAEIFDLMPPEYIPKYKLIPIGDTQEALEVAQQMGYPLIAKPDIGERGNLVQKIESSAELSAYLKKCPVPFLLQEYVDYPIELGVFYIRFPGEQSGQISSIVQKDFLHVVGDGTHNVAWLLKRNPRATLLLDTSQPHLKEVLEMVPREGDKVLVEPIGNHCRGTTFLNETSKVDQKLTSAFNQIAERIDGFCFGRFDLRCRSFEELSQLKHFKILELNGAGAEPGHIYHPGFSIWEGYRVIFWHLKVLAQISKANKKRGIDYWSFSAGMKKMKAIRQYNRLIKES